MPVGRTATTDDNGDFRLFGVTPGQYYLQATWRPNNPVGPDGGNQPAYAPMFFPGVADAIEAQRFTLGIGQQVNDLVMALKPAQAPMARPRSFSGNEATMMARLPGTRSAAPTP